MAGPGALGPAGSQKVRRERFVAYHRTWEVPRGYSGCDLRSPQDHSKKTLPFSILFTGGITRKDNVRSSPLLTWSLGQVATPIFVRMCRHRPCRLVFIMDDTSHVRSPWPSEPWDPPRIVFLCPHVGSPSSISISPNRRKAVRHACLQWSIFISSRQSHSERPKATKAIESSKPRMCIRRFFLGCATLI